MTPDPPDSADRPSWAADTRPRRPSVPLAATAPAEDSASALRFPLVAPLAIVFGLAALGVLVGLGAVLLIRAQMVPVTVIISGDARQTYTSADTVGQLLDELGIVVGEFDTTVPSRETPLVPDMVIRVDKARGVILTIDGESRLFWTPLVNPAEILASAGVHPGEMDRVLVDGTQTAHDDLDDWPVPATHITLRHAVRLRIDDSGTESVVHTTGDTVGEALFEAGVMLYLADTVQPDLRTPITSDLDVTIERSQPVTIIADGKRIETRTRGDTVADALADAGVALVGQDYTIPGEDAEIRPGMHIRVIRVIEETIIEESPLPFETVLQADPERELDQRAVIQEGQPGLQQTYIRVRYENGVEVAREPEETVVVREATNRIVAYGTNVVLRTIDTPEGPREYWRVLRLYATSYHPAALGGDDVTATGRRLQKGVVGVDRTLIPFGTELYVPGYGLAVAADTGPARASRLWIDLGYSDHDYEPWHRYVDVYLLTPVPPVIDYHIGQ